MDLLGLGEVFRIIMHRPNIHHNNGVFRNKISFIPIVFRHIMVMSKLIGGSPSQCFLALQNMSVAGRKP